MCSLLNVLNDVNRITNEVTIDHQTSSTFNGTFVTSFQSRTLYSFDGLVQFFNQFRGIASEMVPSIDQHFEQTLQSITSSSTQIFQLLTDSSFQTTACYQTGIRTGEVFQRRYDRTEERTVMRFQSDLDCFSQFRSRLDLFLTHAYEQSLVLLKSSFYLADVFQVITNRFSFLQSAIRTNSDTRGFEFFNCLLDVHYCIVSFFWFEVFCFIRFNSIFLRNNTSGKILLTSFNSVRSLISNSIFFTSVTGIGSFFSSDFTNVLGSSQT
ncbi:hypothetical protein D3C75_841180 [compost metagenome]